MFAGSEGPESAVAGRYEGAPNPSSAERTFLALFSLSQSPARRRRAPRGELSAGARRRWGAQCRRPVPMGSACRHRRGRHRLREDRRCGWAATCPLLDTPCSEPTDAPEGGDLGRCRRCRHTGCRRRSAWYSPAWWGPLDTARAPRCPPTAPRRYTSPAHPRPPTRRPCPPAPAHPRPPTRRPCQPAGPPTRRPANPPAAEDLSAYRRVEMAAG